MSRYVSLDDLLRMEMPIFIRTGRHDGELFQQTEGVTRYAIDKLETITEQDFTRKGEWKSGYTMLDTDVLEILKCSCCRKGYQTRLAEKWKYCPNCGAKMEMRE